MPAGAPIASLESTIHLVRGHKVMLDADLAAAYGVTTKALLAAFERNVKMFPEDFAFQIDREELKNLRSQNVTSKRQLPWVFTECGAGMVANFLENTVASDACARVTRAFVELRMRDLPDAYKELARHFTDRPAGASTASLESTIHLVRGQRVMLDADLAAVYETTTKALLETFKQNREAFPEGCVFQLDGEELKTLKSQLAPASLPGGRRLPWAFTDRGAGEMVNILRSVAAAGVAGRLMRTFSELKLRDLISAHPEVALRMPEQSEKLNALLGKYLRAEASPQGTNRQGQTTSRKKSL